MAQVTNTFIAGKMNKSLDDRLIPKNQYKDGLNIRVDSSDASEAGRVENEKGNERLAQLVFRTTDQGDISLSSAKTIGAYADGQNETIYYFVHDPTVSIGGTTYKYDAIISYNVEQNSLRYIIEQVHPVLSAGSTVLNFDPEHLITGVDLIRDDNGAYLYFTDDLNPPRYINVNRTYPGILRAAPYSSALIEDDISVIVKPPSEAPGLELGGQAQTSNYMQDKFICFAYRWRYVDGHYSALSQFTKPAFLPGSFAFDSTLQENKNMKNGFAEATISFNTGSELVTDIEVVFKEITSNNVYSIQRFNKEELGYSNNATETTTFSNQKIFTLLDPNQLGRLYDNVPLKAKAQTTMGNRIIYGNYVEGYDLTDTNDNKIKTNFTTELRNPFVSQEEVTESLITSATSGVSQYRYTTISQLSGINNYYQPYPFAVGSYNLGFDLDFSSVTFPLPAGQVLSIDISFRVNQTQIDNANPDGTSGFFGGTFDINQTYVLESSANSVADLISQNGFVDAFGGDALAINTYNYNGGGFSAGRTLADKILAIYESLTFIPLSRFVVTYGGSGVNSYQGTQGSATSFTSSGSEFELTDSGKNFVTAGVEVEDIVIFRLSSKSSLPNQSPAVNNFKVTEVAVGGDVTKLKLVLDGIDNYNNFPISGDEYAIYNNEDYQTVLITNPSADVIRFQLPHSKYWVDAGTGPFELFYRAAVQSVSAELRVTSQETLKSDRDYELGIIYMDDYSRSSNVIVSSADATTFIPLQSAKNQNFIRVAIPTTMTAPSWATRYKFAIKQNKDAYKEIFTDYACQSQNSSPAGSGFVYFKLSGDNVSKVNEGDAIYIKGDRRNGGSTYESSTEDVTRVVLSKELLGQGDIGSDYVSNGGNAATGAFENPSGVYIRVKQESVAPFDIPDVNTNIDFSITLETVADELDSFVYYEGVESYPIVNGYHEDGNGNSNQLSTLDIDTTFFNAYTFFNGVESSSIFDRITTKPLALGNRVYSTSEEEYKQIRRTADLTYSGVYQGEVGINKLNEFNLSLANFKELEESFGPIQKLFARETDVLVLQEDKISYVLAGKNLLSDSIGGGSITSVPEVLGTQIARKEEYGISFNPESFASYGYDRYFTDVKRGAVLQLRGGSAQSDQLTVISEFGMRSYFRDTLEPKLYKQVIGAYDEYSNEYVLSASDDNIPQEAFVIRCGSEVIVEGNTTFVVQLGEGTGSVTIIAERISGSGTVDLDATWNAATTNIGTGESGDFDGFFTKSLSKPTTAEFTYTGTAKYRILVNCPVL